MIDRIRVVFPMPLRPRTAIASPSPILTSMPNNTWLEP